MNLAKKLLALLVTSTALVGTAQAESCMKVTLTGTQGWPSRI